LNDPIAILGKLLRCSVSVNLIFALSSLPGIVSLIAMIDLRHVAQESALNSSRRIFPENVKMVRHYVFGMAYLQLMVGKEFALDGISNGI